MKRQIIPLLLFLFCCGKCLASSAQATPEDFRSFLKKFTASATFQYSRIRFPLETPIIVVTNTDQEKAVPFTKDRWPLLDAEILQPIKTYQAEEDATYIARFAVDDPERKEFEAGYEDGELDLRVVFALKDGKWFVIDCYTAVYAFVPSGELDSVTQTVKEENALFVKRWP